MGDLWGWPLAVLGLGQHTFTTDDRHLGIPWYSLAGRKRNVHRVPRPPRGSPSGLQPRLPEWPVSFVANNVRILAGGKRCWQSVRSPQMQTNAAD